MELWPWEASVLSSSIVVPLSIQCLGWCVCFFMLLDCVSQPLAFLPDPRLDWENIPVVPALIPAWECELVVPLHYATPRCPTLLLCHPLTVRLYLLLVQSPAISIPSIPLAAPPTRPTQVAPPSSRYKLCPQGVSSVISTYPRVPSVRLSVCLWSCPRVRQQWLFPPINRPF